MFRCLFASIFDCTPKIETLSSTLSSVNPRPSESISPIALQRYINGIISQFTQGGASTRFAHYSATLVPWFWLLTRTSDCRIFQNKTATDIIQQIFKEYGFADY
ncbi:MAG: contractile injection system protein, VgrG/Pvc8 family [Pyrinomonadaceae bacterium]